MHFWARASFRLSYSEPIEATNATSTQDDSASDGATPHEATNSGTTMCGFLGLLVKVGQPRARTAPWTNMRRTRAAQATASEPPPPGRSGGRSRTKVDYAALAGPRHYGKRGSSEAQARQVLDLKAAGCRDSQQVLSEAAGVSSSAVSRLRARDQKEAPPTTTTNHQIPLRLNENSPTLMCTQEGPAEGEAPPEARNRVARNYRRRKAVLFAAAVAAAAQSAQVKECNY